MLPNEEEPYEDLGALLRRSYGASEPADEFVDRLHERLVSELADTQELRVSPLSATSRSPEPASPWNRITHWVGGLSMRQRIVALGGVGAAAVVGFVLLWGGTFAKRVSAMEKMAENIRQAKSYAVKVVSEVGAPPTAEKSIASLYWLAPDSIRVEKYEGKELASVDILHASKPGIHISRKDKKFRRESPYGGQATMFTVLGKLGEFSGQADRDLGTRQIDRCKARGFGISIGKIAPDFQPGTLWVWVDPQTNLPVLVEMGILGAPGIIRLEEFRWNVDLDPKLFDVTPPAGYADGSVPWPSVAEQVPKITEALRSYAELAGGHYPRVKAFYADAIRDDVLRKAGLQVPPTSAERNSEAFRKANRALQGLGFIQKILRDDPEAVYNGKTVGPSDKDKVLLRWKLDDGRYEVIFGDLRSQTVTSERLRALEGK